MRHLKLGLAIAVSLCLASCGPLKTLTPPAPKTPAQTVYDIKASLVAAEDVALGYERSQCGIQVPCTAPGAAQINQAIPAADKAVNAAEAKVKANGSDTSAIAAAQAAVQALQALIAQYDPSAATVAAPTGE